MTGTCYCQFALCIFFNQLSSGILSHLKMALTVVQTYNLQALWLGAFKQQLFFGTVLKVLRNQMTQKLHTSRPKKKPKKQPRRPIQLTPITPSDWKISWLRAHSEAFYYVLLNAPTTLKTSADQIKLSTSKMFTPKLTPTYSKMKLRVVLMHRSPIVSHSLTLGKSRSWLASSSSSSRLAL